VVASWQSDSCLLFKLIKIFFDLLSMEAVQTYARLNSDLISEWLYWRKFKWKKITSEIPIELYAIQTLTKVLYCSVT